MSILIKGMEMPKNTTLIVISPDGTVEVSRHEGIDWITLKEKAIPVPSHGDLEDRDKLRERRV